MKFKLIKEYPDSPKLGTIIEYYGSYSIDLEEAISVCLRTGEPYKPITEYPEFWEEQDIKKLRNKKIDKILLD